jgi:hypothetical protein
MEQLIQQQYENLENRMEQSVQQIDSMIRSYFVDEHSNVLFVDETVLQIMKTFNVPEGMEAYVFSHILASIDDLLLPTNKEKFCYLDQSTERNKLILLPPRLGNFK